MVFPARFGHRYSIVKMAVLLFVIEFITLAIILISYSE